MAIRKQKIVLILTICFSILLIANEAHSFNKFYTLRKGNALFEQTPLGRLRLSVNHNPSGAFLMIQDDGHRPIIEIKAVQSTYKNDLYYNSPIDGTDRGNYTLLNTTYGRHCTISNRSVGFEFNGYEITIKLLDWKIDRIPVNKSIAYTSNKMIDEYSFDKIRFQLTITK